MVGVDHRHQGDRTSVDDHLAVAHGPVEQPNRLQGEVDFAAFVDDPTLGKLSVHRWCSYWPRVTTSSMVVNPSSLALERTTTTENPGPPGPTIVAVRTTSWRPSSPVYASRSVG